MDCWTTSFVQYNGPFMLVILVLGGCAVDFFVVLFPNLFNNFTVLKSLVSVTKSREIQDTKILPLSTYIGL